MPKCKKGEILRVGHTRTMTKKGSKKSSKKKSIRIKEKCIKATSQTGEKTSDVTKAYLEERQKMYKHSREKFGTPKCKKGEIVREGYERKSKSGKKALVKPICVHDVGLTGKSKRTIYIEPDRLSKYGYHDVGQKSDLARHKALKRAMISGEKPLSVSRRLNALSTLSRNTHPKLSRTFKEDSEWIKFTDEYKLSRLK